MSSEDLKKRIEAVLLHAPESRHSYFQLKHFVLGKEPTVQAQMWQALRELQTRKETIDSLELEIEDTKDRLELVDVESEKEQIRIRQTLVPNYPSGLVEREIAIKNRQYARQKISLEKHLRKLEKQLQFAWQEARFFLQAFEGLRKIEPLKDYDDLEAQKDYWNERVGQYINLKMLLQQPLDIDIVQTALALHDDAPIKSQMAKTLRHIEDQMNKLKQQYFVRLETREKDLLSLESKEKDAIAITQNHESR
jgi:hypothetical protein